MRFSHAADCHLGGHRDPTLRELGENAFARFVDETIAAHVDFTLIAGDLFNSAIPGIDALKCAVTHLSRLREAGIPVYAIGGSHDASPTGKSMLDVLERAGLLIDVGAGAQADSVWTLRIITDPKTGYRITGIPGRQAMLDHEQYAALGNTAVPEPARTIFLVHTAIAGLHNVPGALDARRLPPGCAYYASGHVHEPGVHDIPGVGIIGYPGPLFPNSFSELEELGNGGYILWEDGKAVRKPVPLAPVARVRVDASGMDPNGLAHAIRERLATARLAGAIVTLRLEGTLASGSLADLDLRGIAREAIAQGARAVLRNTARLSTPMLSESPSAGDGREAVDVESELIAQHEGQLPLAGVEDSAALARTLLTLLSREQHEGERAMEYRDSIVTEALRALDDAQRIKR